MHITRKPSLEVAPTALDQRTWQRTNNSSFLLLI